MRSTSASQWWWPWMLLSKDSLVPLWQRVPLWLLCGCYRFTPIKHTFVFWDLQSVVLVFKLADSQEVWGLWPTPMRVQRSFVCLSLTLITCPPQDWHGGWAGFSMQHRQSRRRLWRCALHPLGWRWRWRCCPGPGCPEGLWGPQQL